MDFLLFTDLRDFTDFLPLVDFFILELFLTLVDFLPLVDFLALVDFLPFTTRMLLTRLLDLVTLPPLKRKVCETFLSALIVPLRVILLPPLFRVTSYLPAGMMNRLAFLALTLPLALPFISTVAS